MSLKMLFHFKLSMEKFRCNVLELFFSNRWTRGGRKNSKLRIQPTFQDQSDSPSSSLEFYKTASWSWQASFFRVTLSVDDPLQNPKIVWKLRKFSRDDESNQIFEPTTEPQAEIWKLSAEWGPDLQKQKKWNWASNRQKEKQNRRDSKCWEKKIKFVFLLASFSLYWKEARADFLFQREKRIFCVFITFESLWRSHWVFFFCLNRTAEKETSLLRSERRE
jgi:hypothetical protein